MKKLKYCLPAIIWMLFIFIMSNQTGTTSSKSSNFLTDIIISIFNLSTSSSDLISTLIRKLSHVLEYIILTSLVYYAVRNITKKHRYYITLLISLLYACFDEIHQLFIPNRTGQLQDVLIDSCGMIIAILIIYIYLRRVKKTE